MCLYSNLATNPTCLYYNFHDHIGIEKLLVVGTGLGNRIIVKTQHDASKTKASNTTTIKIRLIRVSRTYTHFIEHLTNVTKKNHHKSTIRI
jgi:hypothetical protein